MRLIILSSMPGVAALNSFHPADIGSAVSTSIHTGLSTLLIFSSSDAVLPDYEAYKLQHKLLKYITGLTQPTRGAAVHYPQSIGI